jgi:Tol biopolymer transport system component
MPINRPRRVVSTVAVVLFAALWPAGPTGAATAPPAAAGAVTVGSPILAITGAGASALSGTGRFIAYEVFDAGDQARLLRKDRMSGRTKLLNRGIDGGVARGRYSQPPVISADGRRIAFVSSAARLVPDDTNGRSDAFVRDAATDSTILVSRAFDGGISNADSGSISLSKDGRYAVFISRGTDLVPGSTTTNSDVYRRDLTTGSTQQVTLRPDGTPSRGPGAGSADISADGRLVAFSSYKTDLTPVDGQDQEADLFVRDLTTGRTRWLSQNLPVGADPYGVVLSPDGRWVATRWADGSLHLTNVATATTTQVTSEGFTTTGTFTANGRLLVYISAYKAYLRDLTTGIDTELGTPAGGGAYCVTISAGGTLAAFDWIAFDGSQSGIYTVTLSAP